MVSVFDVSQTDGKELPDIAVDELTGSVENYAAFFEALKQESPVPISFEDIPGGAKGYFSHVENRIAIQEGMSEIQTVKTAIHEIAHAKLHAIDPDKKAAPEERKDRHTKEVEAESVAYTVCQRYGIETSDYSFGYIAGWSSDKDIKELKGSLETIRSTAAEMIESIDAKLKLLLAEKAQEQAHEPVSYTHLTEQNLPITEATQPEDMPDEEPEDIPSTELPEGEPIDDEGNAHTRDLLYDKETNKQFITVQTKNGNTFYIVIDYDAPINEEEEQYQTYFLNMVDEADLLALMDDETVAELTTCVCTDKCVAGDVNVDCPVCKNNMSECTGTVPEPETPDEGEETEQPDDTEAPENKTNFGMIIGVVALVGIGGGAYYYFKFVRGKKQKDEDLDFFDDEGYEEEPYINEDDEPDIAEDEETEDEED